MTPNLEYRTTYRVPSPHRFAVLELCDSPSIEHVWDVAVTYGGSTLPSWFLASWIPGVFIVAFRTLIVLQVIQDPSQQRLRCVSVSISGRYLVIAGDGEVLKVSIDTAVVCKLLPRVSYVVRVAA